MNPQIVIDGIHFLKKKGQLMSVKQPKGTDLHSHTSGTKDPHIHRHASTVRKVHVQNVVSTFSRGKL